MFTFNGSTHKSEFSINYKQDRYRLGIVRKVAAKIASKQKQSTPIENVDEKQIDDETDELSIWGKLNNNISTKSQPQDNATSRANRSPTVLGIRGFTKTR
ncbi:hypothetical protein NQ318_009982 [Aromia moschata]|uniref:Uncharacterized protein n=1 Tax=Aromia moschata TaxID=1265417 RepID=A0AAV8Y8R4_9CUCU|nr:hypothetical protein NQ318_009982 [Aromia moschata]